ncbi:hypothetical protein GCM10028805_57500 [Spirosoma harenae]
MTEIIKFHEVELLGEQENEQVWIPIKPICDGVGVDSQTQYKQIKKHPILSRVYSLRYVHDASNRQQEMFCLPIDYVHGWLFSINIDRMKAEVKPVLIIYQQECYRVLYEHFFGNTRLLQLDAEREHKIIARNKEINRLVRDLMAEQATNKLELQTIQNRRAVTYRLEPIHDGVEKEYEKRKFLGQQLKIEV